MTTTNAHLVYFMTWQTLFVLVPVLMVFLASQPAFAAAPHTHFTGVVGIPAGQFAPSDKDWHTRGLLTSVPIASAFKGNNGGFNAVSFVHLRSGVETAMETTSHHCSDPPNKTPL